MWIVCITSVRHVLTVNGYGGRQTKENEKSWCFKGWETLVILIRCRKPQGNYKKDGLTTMRNTLKQTRNRLTVSLRTQSAGTII